MPQLLVPIFVYAAAHGTELIVGALVSGALSVGLSFALGALLKPKNPKSKRDVSDQITTSSQRNQPVPVVFGRGRLGGTLVLFPQGSGAFQYHGTRSKDNNGQVYEGHAVIALCEGPIQAAGNPHFDQKPKIDYFQNLLDKKVEPEMKGTSVDQRRDATFYVDNNLGTDSQSIHAMVLDADPNIAPNQTPQTTGFTTLLNGERILIGSQSLPIPYRNTATAAIRYYCGQDVRGPDFFEDVAGPDLTIRLVGSNSGTNTGDVAGAVIGYDSYTENFFWTMASSTLTSSPLGMALIHRVGLHGRQHTPPPNAVSSDITHAWYLGRHDVLVMQDPDDGSIFHVGCWGISRDSDLWEKHTPSEATGIPGGYSNAILAWHLDEYNGVLHTIHEDSEIVYIMRWSLLTGRVERMDTDLSLFGSGTPLFLYTPDSHAYVVATDGTLIAMSGDTGETFASTPDIDISGAKGLFASGNRVGVVSQSGVMQWDLAETSKTFGPYGGSATDLSEGAFGAITHAVQNTRTGQVALVKPASGTVAFINFIPSTLEEISDISAMGTQGQPEFQTFWDKSTTVSGTKFSWTTGVVEEPKERKVGSPPTAVFRKTSPTATFTFKASDDKLVFGSSSALDDILILIKSTESVTDDWDGTSGGATRPHVTFTIPANSIFIASDRGEYVFEGDDNFWPTCEKTLDDGTNTLHLPDGDGVSTHYTSADLIAAGFTVYKLTDQIPRSVLAANGFVSGDTLSYKLVHIVCGGGGAWINDMGIVSSSVPILDPDTVAGWIRDWSTRTYNAWNRVQLEGRSSLAAAAWALVADISSLDTARWGAGLDQSFFDMPSFEGLHFRCVAPWKYANAPRLITNATGSEHIVDGDTLVDSASGAAVSVINTYRYAERFKLDYVLDSEAGVTEVLAGQILGACNGFRKQTGGKLEVGVKLPGAFPCWHFHEDNIKDATPQVSFIGQPTQLNRVRVQYREVRDRSRINFGNADNDWSQNQYGRTTTQNATLSGVGRQGQADLLAELLLAEVSTPRLGAQFSTHFLGHGFSPNDVIEVTHRNTPLSRRKMRIIQSIEQEDGAFQFVLEEHKPILQTLANSSANSPPANSLGSLVGTDEATGDCEEQTGSTGSGVRWFNGGSAYPTGTYDIFYVDNCYKLTADPGGFAVAGYELVVRDSITGEITPLIATDGNSDAPAVPNPPHGFDLELVAVTANTGQSKTIVMDAAGAIGLRLKSPPAFSNFGDYGPAPTYQICLHGTSPESDSAMGSASDSASASASGSGSASASDSIACIDADDIDTVISATPILDCPTNADNADVNASLNGLHTHDANVNLTPYNLPLSGGDFCDPSGALGSGAWSGESTWGPNVNGIIQEVCTDRYTDPDGSGIRGHILRIVEETTFDGEVTLWAGWKGGAGAAGTYVLICGESDGSRNAAVTTIVVS